MVFEKNKIVKKTIFIKTCRHLLRIKRLNWTIFALHQEYELSEVRTSFASKFPVQTSRDCVEDFIYYRIYTNAR